MTNATQTDDMLDREALVAGFGLIRLPPGWVAAPANDRVNFRFPSEFRKEFQAIAQAKGIDESAVYQAVLMDWLISNSDV